MTGFPGWIEHTEVRAALHEISQPLTVVGLALSLAELAPDGLERQQALQAAQEQCQRAMECMQQLRAVLQGARPLPQARKSSTVKTRHRVQVLPEGIA